MEISVSVNTLLDLRNIRGLSQEEAADLCRISRVYWNELEAGKRRGSPKKIEAIGQGFGLPYYEIAIILHNTYVAANGGHSNNTND